jgi:branched-chain amino acid aminotransferase group I
LERPQDLLVYLNDKIVPRSQALVSVFDAAFQSGDGVWEGLRLYNGVVFQLEAHLDRLFNSAKALEIKLPMDRAALRDAVCSTLRANGFHDGVHIRLMVSRGERRTSGMNPKNVDGRATVVIIAEYKPVPEIPAAVRLRTVGIRKATPDTLDPGIHSANQLNSILAKLEANRAGVDGALMLDRDGFVAETDSANIFMVRSNELVTPRTIACLHGITRGLVLELARRKGWPATEAEISLFDLYSSNEVFTTGTVQELLPVVEIDGRAIGSGGIGLVTSQLLEAYRQLVTGSPVSRAPS